MSPSPSPAFPAEALLVPDAKGLSRAVQLLREGKLVILPTETIYGIALNLLSSAARALARQVKSVDAATPSPPWVIHVAQPEDIFTWVPHLSKLGRRLITKALPGPVAFEIKLTPTDLAAARARLGPAADETLHDGCLTLRCPDASYTQQILFDAAVPIAIIGAGTPAQSAVFEIADLPESLFATDGKSPPPIAAALDGGPTRYRRSSTLVRIDGERFSILRPGVIDERIIQKMADFNILFLCSGNTCRSPMAAAIATRLLADRLHIEPSELPLRHIVVQSAGLHANRGLRAAPEAVATVKFFKADLSAHFSQPATVDLLRRADLIYTMTEAHREEVLELLPAAAPKTHRLDADADVEDPIGAGLQVYEQVAGHLAELLKHRLSELPL